MGGCCCSSRKSHLVGTPVYYYCPESFEELATPSPRTRASVGSSAITRGLLVDIPDTFRAPAPPLPYDMLLGRRIADSESITKGRVSISESSSFKTCEEDNKPNVILSPMKSNVSKGYKQLVDDDNDEVEEEEEDDSCPICFEDYDVENPRLTTKCDHDFHLSCLLEWIERSDTCPICDKEVVFDECLK